MLFFFSFLQKYLEASEFLQNVVYINIPLTEEEKIERYNTLSNLYLLIGMKRKAGFFHRIAAMQCVAPNNPKPAWNTCYYILLQALSGYRISLDPKDTPIDHVEGWPATQLRVLHELIYSSRKMGNPAIAIRHITYLFHTLFDYLSREERIELVSILRSYTSRCEGGAQTLALDNGLILPPVPFYKFPRVYSFKPVCPPEHLLPCKYQKKKCSSISQLSTSPFIYSPIQNTSSAKVNSQVSEMDFHWVEGEKCAVEVEAQNPLPIPLDVNDIDLLTEGATFKGEPCNITVPGHARVRFNITGTVPQKSTLSIMGYLTTVFGCRSRCRFRDMHYLDQTQFNVKVVPRLPEMSLNLVPERKEVLTSSLMKHGSVTSVAFSVYSGQSCEFEVRLNNAGQIPVDMVDIELHSSSHKDMLKDIVLWNQFNVNSQLPVTPGGHASFTLYINTEHVTSQTTAVDQMLSGKLVFQYSDVGGLESGFCRQCCLMFTLHIQPVVLVKDVQVKQSKRNGSEFCLELLLENCVTQDIIIASQPDTAVPISSLSQARVSFHVKKYQLPLENLKEVELTEDSAVANENQSFNSTVRMSQSQLESQSGQIILDQSLNSPEDELSILTNEIAQHLKNLLDIRWNIPDKNCEGKMQLNCTKWDTELLESLVTGPLSFDIEVNGSPHEQVSEVKVRSGDSVVIKCCAINTSDCDINDVKLTLHSEAFNPASEVSHSSCLVLGQTSSHQSSIPPKASVVLDWQVLYFCPGLYEVEVSVTGFTNSLSLFTGCIKDRLGEKQWTSVPVIVKVEE